jgi:ABC-type oligopeptide transport system ATPase subunit
MTGINDNELLAYLITPSYMEVRRDYAKVNDYYYRIIEAVGYPRKIDDGWLRSFLSKNENYDISLHIEPSSIDQTITFLYDQINKQTADLFMSTEKGTPNPALEIKLSDTRRLHELLYKGEEKLFRVSLYINNKESSLDKLDMLTEKCKANLNAIMVVPKTANFRMAPALRSCLPIGTDKLGVQQEFPTNSLAATFPFISPAKPDKIGVFLGNELETLNRIHLNFDKYDNKHFFILGTSGSGKSYTAKSLMVQILFNADSDIFIIDPNAEYAGTVAALGGQNVQIAQDSEDSINLFDLGGQSFQTKMLELIAAFDIIVGGLTESQKGALNRLLPRAYEDSGILPLEEKTWKNEPPTFSDVYEECLKMYKEKKARSRDLRTLEVLVNRLSMYSKNGFFSFLDRRTSVELKAKIVNFDLSKIPTALKPLTMFIILGFISRRMKADKAPKFIFIDEGWGLLRNKNAEDYVLEYIKTARKYGVGLGFITQEIEDFDKADAGKSILNLSATKILMKESTSNIEAISASLKLNAEERDYLIKCSRGSGLLISEEGHFKFQITVPEMMHNLFTTDPKVTNVNVETVDRPVERPAKRFSLREGFFFAKDLTEEQVQMCMEHGYTEITQNMFGTGSGPRILVKPPTDKQSPMHYCFCRILQVEIEKYGKNALLYDSVKPDVVVFDKENIAFEVETGSHDEYTHLKEKFDRVKEEFRTYYILITDYTLRKKYEPFGKVITRTEIKETLERSFNYSARNVERVQAN